MMRIMLALRSKRGAAYPFIAFLSFAIVIAACAVMEYMRLTIITKGVRDAVQSAVISVSVGNYADVYAPIRDGYSSGQVYDASSGTFKPAVNTGDIYGRLDSLLGLDNGGGGTHVKYIGAATEYRLSGLAVSVTNTSLAPSDPSAAQMFRAVATLRLEVPLSFGWKGLPPMAVNLKCESGWRAKF